MVKKRTARKMASNVNIAVSKIDTTSLIKKYWNKGHTILDDGKEPVKPSTTPYVMYNKFYHYLSYNENNHLVHIMRENRDILLVPIGDMHWGHECSSVEAWEQDIVAYLSLDSKKLGVYFILLGDYTENASSHSLGSNFECVLDNTEQLEFAYNMLLPLALNGKIMMMLSGNHGRRFYKEEGISRDQELYAKLLEAVETAEARGKNIAFPRYKDSKNRTITPPFTGFGRVFINNNEYSFMATHGSSGGGRMLGSRLNTLDHHTKNVQDVDIMMMGHVHQKSFAETSISIPGAERTLWRNQLFLTTPGYLLYEGSYAERKALRPGTLGTPCVSLSSGKFKRATYISSYYQLKP